MGFDWLLILFLLLPVSFVAGWWISGRHTSQNTGRGKAKIHPDYFKGLNYVLDEQPDKAIEIFVKMVEVDSETVETHLTLGNLFRRRGEVDRAIRIHQNLIARPALSKQYRAQALLELGMDYLRLGILDRAESLFLELVEMDMLVTKSFSFLLDIYQQEKEWNKAISTAKRLESITGVSHANYIAQFHCELAQAELNAEDSKAAMISLKRALNLDPKCVRASLMEGNILMKSGNYRAAIKSLKRVEKQGIDYLAEILLPLQECYEKTGSQIKFKLYLEDIVNSTNNIDALILLADIVARESGEDAAISLLSTKLKSMPTVTGVDHFLTYVINKSDGELKNYLLSIKELTARLLQVSAAYQCSVCGFEAKNMHWQCPGCKSWNTLKKAETVLNE